jgi:16S rRNA (cytidine1402-2'-O)-methyltransferase
MTTKSIVYLVPSFLAEEAVETIPPYVLTAVKDCQVIFAENERTARRFLKSLDRSIVIDNFQWFAIHKAEAEQQNAFVDCLSKGLNIAIISEAGCPGVADPGQILVEVAQQHDATVKPLVGPSSILLALMASGLNGQQFRFNGYLPIDTMERNNKIKSLEEEASRTNTTQIFIETPYRNNALFEAITKNCKNTTKLCIAADITSPKESIKTKTVAQWKQSPPALHKIPAIFLLLA